MDNPVRIFIGVIIGFPVLAMLIILAIAGIDTSWMAFKKWKVKMIREVSQEEYDRLKYVFFKRMWLHAILMFAAAVAVVYFIPIVVSTIWDGILLYLFVAAFLPDRNKYKLPRYRSVYWTCLLFNICIGLPILTTISSVMGGNIFLAGATPIIFLITLFVSYDNEDKEVDAEYAEEMRKATKNRKKKKKSKDFVSPYDTELHTEESETVKVKSEPTISESDKITRDRIRQTLVEKYTSLIEHVGVYGFESAVIKISQLIDLIVDQSPTTKLSGYETTCVRYLDILSSILDTFEKTKPVLTDTQIEDERTKINSVLERLIQLFENELEGASRTNKTDLSAGVATLDQLLKIQGF